MAKTFTAADCANALDNAQTLSMDCHPVNIKLSDADKEERAVNCEIIRVLSGALVQAQKSLAKHETNQRRVFPQ